MLRANDKGLRTKSKNPVPNKHRVSLKSLLTLLLFSGLFYVAASCNNTPRLKVLSLMSAAFLVNYKNLPAEPLTNALAAPDEKALDLLALDEALERLAKIDPQQVQIVELRYFSGLDVPETAEILNISTATVKRDWAVARAWLKHELTRGEET